MALPIPENQHSLCHISGLNLGISSFFFFQAKITMQTFKRKILPQVIFSLDFYLVSCDV